jgi:hypothetical protein
MNKGYAFGFLIVLLVIILGLYVAFTGFMSSRDAIRAQSVSSSDTGAVERTSAPTRLGPTSTNTAIVIPTPLPGITATLTAVAPIAETESQPPAEATAPVPTEPPPTLPPATQVAATPTVMAQPPTPVPVPAYQFRLAGPPNGDPSYQNCCYILGTVRDAAGKGLEGVQIQAFNEWNTLPPAPTKGGGEAGQYDIPIGHDVVTWYIMVIDAGGSQISSQVQIQFDPNQASAYRVDWQRTY